MSSITLGSKLPGDDKNGLVAAANSLLNHPHHMVAVVMLVDCGKVVEDIDEGTRTPLARIRRIEVVPQSEYRSADALLRSAMAARHGSQELPLADQADLFSFLHPETTLPEELQGPDHVTVTNVNDGQDDDEGEENPWPGDAEPAAEAAEEPPADDLPVSEDAVAAARRKRADDRIAAVHKRNAGRTPPKIGDIIPDVAKTLAGSSDPFTVA